MNLPRQSLRIGGLAILFALLLRLSGSGMLQQVSDFLSQPTISSWIIYLETGRIVRFSPSFPDVEVFSMESHAPEVPELTPLPVFSAEDGAAVTVKSNTDLEPDLSELIARPLSWDLTGEDPTVLILHTHGTESYTKQSGENYTESSAYRTLDKQYNMISLGDHLTDLLEAGGIRVVHDRELHDYPSYSGSYNHARKSIAAYLKEHPSIRLVLDLHRDASGDNDNQMRTKATVDGNPSAQLMLVVGTNGTGLTHPDWEENLALGLKLHTQCERISPGIMRYVNLRAQRFNQDLSPGALIVEVGAAGNTHTEALRAIDILAEAILDLAKGTGQWPVTTRGRDAPAGNS